MATFFACDSSQDCRAGKREVRLSLHSTTSEPLQPDKLTVDFGRPKLPSTSFRSHDGALSLVFRPTDHKHLRIGLQYAHQTHQATFPSVPKPKNAQQHTESEQHEQPERPKTSEQPQQAEDEELKSHAATPVPAYTTWTEHRLRLGRVTRPRAVAEAQPPTADAARIHTGPPQTHAAEPAQPRPACKNKAKCTAGPKKTWKKNGQKAAFRLPLPPADAPSPSLSLPQPQPEPTPSCRSLPQHGCAGVPHTWLGLAGKTAYQTAGFWTGVAEGACEAVRIMLRPKEEGPKEEEH